MLCTCGLSFAQAMDAKLERRKNYCALGVALVEDLPMGAPQRRCPVESRAFVNCGLGWDLAGISAACALPLARRCFERNVPRQFDSRLCRFKVSMERAEHLQQHQPQLRL